LQRGLEEAAESLREQLEAAAGRSVEAVAEEAARLAAESLSSEVVAEVQRVGGELAVVRSEVEGIVGWRADRLRKSASRAVARPSDSSPTGSLGAEFACVEDPGSLAVRSTAGEHGDCIEEAETEKGFRTTPRDRDESDYLAVGLATARSQLEQLAGLPAEVEQVKSKLAEAGKEIDELRVAALAQRSLEESLRRLEGSASGAATSEELEGVRAEVARATSETEEKLKDLEAFREQAVTKEDLQGALASVDEIKSAVVELADKMKSEPAVHGAQSDTSTAPSDRQASPSPQPLCDADAAMPGAVEASIGESGAQRAEPLVDVVVTRPFTSDSEVAVELHPGQGGFISAVDEDGDILAFFDNVQKPQWVFKQHFGNLCFYQRALWVKQALTLPRKEVDAMSMSELKDLIARVELSVTDCFSKSALVRRAQEAKMLMERAQSMQRKVPLPLGLRLEYKSPTQQKWVCCKVTAVDEVQGHIRVDVKPGHWFSLEEQAMKFRPLQVSIGQRVLYRSCGSSSWVPTRVTRIREDDAVEVALAPGRFLTQLEQLDTLREEDVRPKLGPGDTVSVLQPFRTDSEDPVDLEEGQVGCVMELDGDGDALVDFEDHDLAQWIIGSNFDKLRVLASKGAAAASAGEAPEAEADGSDASDASDVGDGAAADALKSMACKRRGSIVLVQEDFMSDSRDSVPLKCNAVGVISEVDSEGDLLVSFPGERGKQWVASDNQKKLVVLDDQPRLAPGGRDGDQQVAAPEIAGGHQQTDPSLVRGQVVIVKEDFVSDSARPHEIKALVRGRVSSVGAEGDVVIDFEEGGLQTVRRQKLGKLAVLRNVPAQSDSESESSKEGGRPLAGTPASRPQLKRGSEALFKSATHGAWIECKVDDVRGDGAVTVDVKPKVWLTTQEQEVRLRSRGEAIFREGELVQYQLSTGQKWIDARIAGVRPDGRVSLDGQAGQWFSVDDQMSKLRSPPIREGLVVEAICEIMSDSQASTLIKRGTRGVVQEVDEDGDTLLKFDGHSKQEWVFKGKTAFLRAVGAKSQGPPARVTFADNGAGVNVDDATDEAKIRTR